jgi:hypothetical protein
LAVRVLVELLDKDPIENVLGACIFQPELAVFLCDKNDQFLAKENAVYRIFKRRKLGTKLRFYYFDAASPAEIRNVLAAVVRDYPGCVFDYSGGKDLVLLQAGAYCIPLGVPGYYVDVPTGRFVDVQHCGHLAAKFAIPAFSAEDVFAISGATILGSGHFDKGEEQSEGFEETILAIWKIVQRNPKAWGEFVAYIQAVSSGSSMQVLQGAGPKQMKSGRYPARFNAAIFEQLYKLGVFTHYNESEKQVQFAFKSSLYKKCLLNQGIWLELFCYVSARCSSLFDDVRTSVLIDWAGKPTPKGGAGMTTKNEVDVVLVKGIVPVFVSCKMSAPSPLALSEIKLLSAKFGGSMARTVTLTGDALGDENKALKTRAADLDILLLDRNDLQDGEKLAKALLRAAQGRTTLG